MSKEAESPVTKFVIALFVSFAVIGFGIFLVSRPTTCSGVMHPGDLCTTYINGQAAGTSNYSATTSSQVEFGEIVTLIGGACLLGALIWGTLLMLRRVRSILLRFIAVFLALGVLAAVLSIPPGITSPAGKGWGVTALVFFGTAALVQLLQLLAPPPAQRSRVPATESSDEAGIGPPG